MLQNQSSVDEQVYVTNVQFTCRSNMHELYARISEGVQLSVTQQTLEVASWHKVESRVEFKQEDEVETRVTNAVSVLFLWLRWGDGWEYQTILFKNRISVPPPTQSADKNDKSWEEKLNSKCYFRDKVKEGSSTRSAVAVWLGQD